MLPARGWLQTHCILTTDMIKMQDTLQRGMFFPVIFLLRVRKGLHNLSRVYIYCKRRKIRKGQRQFRAERGPGVGGMQQRPKGLV